MAETCLGCHLVHANTVRPDSETPEIDQLQDCVAAQKLAMLALLKRIADGKRCEGCGALIYMVRHSLGQVAPYTAAGLNHFVDCPARDQFKRSKP